MSFAFHIILILPTMPFATITLHSIVYGLPIIGLSSKEVTLTVGGGTTWLKEDNNRYII